MTFNATYFDMSEWMCKFGSTWHVVFVVGSASFSAQPIVPTHTHTHTTLFRQKWTNASPPSTTRSTLSLQHCTGIAKISRTGIFRYAVPVKYRKRCIHLRIVEQEQSECVSCPYDRRHRVPRDRQESHLQKCMEKHQKDGSARRKVSVVTCGACVCVCIKSYRSLMANLFCCASIHSCQAVLAIFMHMHLPLSRSRLMQQVNVREYPLCWAFSLRLSDEWCSGGSTKA